MLTTANPEYDRRFRLWRQHSMSVSDTARHGSRDVIFESYPEVGFNYRMTDLQAAVGRVQLSRLPEILAHRRHIAAVYDGLLESLPLVSRPVQPAWARSNWQSYCVRLAPGLDQRTVMQHMLTDGVSGRRGVMCSHREEPYRHHRESLPHSEQSQDTGIILPLPSGMTDEDAAHVVDVLRRAVEAASVHASESTDADDRHA
jgi:dTDP-4-amino-4,6-dideoxygalactose transaminase